MKKLIVAFILLFPAVSYAEPISDELQARLDKYICSLFIIVPDNIESERMRAIWARSGNMFETTIFTKRRTTEVKVRVYENRAELVITALHLMSSSRTYTSTQKCATELYQFLDKWEVGYLDQFLKDNEE